MNKEKTPSLSLTHRWYVVEEGEKYTEMKDTEELVHPDRRPLIASRDSDESELPQAPARPLLPRVTPGNLRFTQLRGQ
jgi:hypothetical protein